MANRKRICPRCGSSNAVKILYGEPSVNYIDNPHPMVLGGCIMEVDSPTNCCLDCDYRWGGKSTNLLSDMILFRAYVGGYFGPSYSVELDPTKGTITYQHTEGGSAVDVQTMPLATETWSKFVKGLIRCEFLDWLDDYTLPGVMDGTSWSVVVLTYDRPICKQGSNGYPGRWSQFCRLISSVSGVTFR